MLFYEGKIDFMHHKRELVFSPSAYDVELITDIETINDFYAFKIQRDVNDNSKGVLFEDEEPQQIDRFVIDKGGKKIIQLAYIFLNVKSNLFYYSCSRNIFESVIKTFFKVDSKHINYNTSLDALDRINSIRLVKTYEGKSTLLSSEESLKSNMNFDIHSVMMEDEQPLKESIQYEFKRGKFFQEKLSKVVDKSRNSDNIKLYISGVDEKGNTITINEFAIKKITVDTLKHFDDYSSKSLKDILLEIEKLA